MDHIPILEINDVCQVYRMPHTFVDYEKRKSTARNERHSACAHRPKSGLVPRENVNGLLCPMQGDSSAVPPTNSNGKGNS